jgi:hypothetical protein
MRQRQVNKSLSDAPPPDEGSEGKGSMPAWGQARDSTLKGSEA